MNKFFNQFLRFNDKLILAVVLILAAILRFYNLDFQSPWLDEIHTLNETNPNVSVSELYGLITRGEQLPPLYFYILYYIHKVFGYSIFVARGFSALLGVITIYLGYIFTKELVNKKVAFYTAVMLCVNYFMIYYSQEARPYMLFMVFLLFSYHRMILFLKDYSVKNAFWYGFASCLMLHSHLIGFFTLFAQIITLCLFYFFQDGINRKQFFKGSVISGIVILILYIPSLDSLLNLFEIKSFWIKYPEKDTLSVIYNSFFGNSEIITFFNIIFFFFFLLWLSKAKEHEDKSEKNELGSFWISIILILWITFTLLVPLIRTYVSVPMLIARYLLAILPPILILFSIGLGQLKSARLSKLLLTLYALFTLVHIVLIKKYYTTVKKAQFREATAFIVENNKDKDKVVTSLSSYLPYFFDKENKNFVVVKAPSIDVYIEKQIKQGNKLESFWYFDGHNRKDEIKKEKNLKFIKENYIVLESYIGFQAWARHYVLKNDPNLKVDFTKNEFNRLKSNNQIKTTIEKFSFDNNFLHAKGWAVLKDVDSQNTRIKLMLFNENLGYIIETEKRKRKDITKSLEYKFNADFSGFEASTDLSYISKGKYVLGVWLENSDNNKESVFLYKKQIEVK